MRLICIAAMIALAGCQTRPERTPDATMRLYRNADNTVTMATQIHGGATYITRITITDE
jgi:hypothetical protein